ncbi:MAG: UDP-N-acetylglucosamine 2-epimerase (non-hydrolyzing) [Clostridiales bacterium]|jgi:UDP-N-acetylglucosamine 2-epimerase (non-hydrolysing)/UDP-GlcNAc:undecaprenyl-phosphate GlcNAc-1-phosphate transferase|nr:UDP-N-acetylglucosamine 2-epimerase (non-hydrolyzing) [Clostridiales bacterium]
MKNKLKVLSIFGTRPEAIKMAPLVLELEKCGEIQSEVCVTAQHRQMLDQVLDVFGITPKYDLDIMKERQTLAEITTNALNGISRVLKDERFDIVLVHGDTTTTFAGSLAAFYNNVKVGHVEAGLRTFDKLSPFPEEVNRRLTGVIADYHFAPTETNRRNLINEGISEKNIYVTGNTVIDALKTTVRDNYSFENEELRALCESGQLSGRRAVLVTAHRRENLGAPLENICGAIKKLADAHSDLLFIYPVHLNPQVQETAQRILGGTRNVRLIKPTSVTDLHNLMARCYFVMTDSGGLQEEAPSLGKPVLVLRTETERPEAVESGTVRVVGVEEKKILEYANLLLSNQSEYDKMAKAINPYGDGHASERIVKALCKV